MRLYQRVALKRRGQNYYFNLNKPVFSEVVDPVIDGKELENMKIRLVNLLKSNGWFLDIIESNYQVPELKKVQ